MKTSILSQVPATDKQISYARVLLADRAVDAAFIERFMARVEEGTGVQRLTKSEASAAITYALRQPRVEQPAPASASEPVVLEPGIYEYDGRIFQVKLNQAKTGRYAMVLTEKGTGVQRLTERGEVISAEYVFAPGAIRDLRPEHRMTADRAEQLSVVFTFCVRCSRHLKAAESVSRGIGPVCIKKI